MPDIIEARTETPFPAWGKTVVIIVGLALVSYSIKTFFTVDIDQMKLTFPYTLLGITCIFIGGFKKQVILSPEGILRVYLAWGASGKDLVPWSKVEKVNIKAFSRDIRASFKFQKKTVNAEFINLSTEELSDFILKFSQETQVKIV